MRRKIHISKALILSSICLFSVHDPEANKTMVHSPLPEHYNVLDLNAKVPVLQILLWI